MKKGILTLLLVCVACTPQETDVEVAAWEAQAQSVTIIRDDWGIPHIYGETDADAVFGMIYAQAEDDFNRIEVNFLNSQGRLAEAEGEDEIWRDLRMKLFIDPADMQTQYDASPQWLKDLMDAWASGLNYYLYTHPEVQPRVLTRFGAVDGAYVQRREYRRRYRTREPWSPRGVLRPTEQCAGSSQSRALVPRPLPWCPPGSTNRI